MDSKEGLRRITRIVSAGAWLWLAGWVVAAVAWVFSEPAIALACALSGVIGFACCQALGWVISGFAGLPREQDGLIRISSLKRIIRSDRSDPTIPQASLGGPTGVGGWLLFFMVILVLSAIRSAGAYMEASEAARTHATWILETPYLTMLQIITCTSVACFLGAYFLLLRVKLRSTINRVIAAIWIAGPLAALADTFCAHLWIPQLGSVWSQNAGPIAGGVIFAIIWTAYLLKSRRVSNTYR